MLGTPFTKQGASCLALGAHHEAAVAEEEVVHLLPPVEVLPCVPVGPHVWAMWVHRGPSGWVCSRVKRVPERILS